MHLWPLLWRILLASKVTRTLTPSKLTLRLNSAINSPLQRNKKSFLRNSELPCQVWSRGQRAENEMTSDKRSLDLKRSIRAGSNLCVAKQRRAKKSTSTIKPKFQRRRANRSSSLCTFQTIWVRQRNRADRRMKQIRITQQAQFEGQASS